ncbi:MAG: pantoate--beta-alanine ligase [Puniceicoccaceae bacterium]
MQVITSVNEMQSFAIAQRARGKLLGFVPTMGALHLGHEGLIAASIAEADCTIVSIFVNPLQFGPNEDLAKYPRQREEDLATCERLGVDVVFTPEVGEIYPPGHSTAVNETLVAADLCGISRPNHFQGVATVCTILFNITRPDVAFFGQKDAQQCAVVSKVISDLHLPVELKIVPTVRDSDGLALSSRNRYLSPEERADALEIYRALQVGKSLVEGGVRSVDRVIAEVHHSLQRIHRLRVIYTSIVDPMTMKPEREVETGKSLLVIACWVDQVRLIDNIRL